MQENSQQLWYEDKSGQKSFTLYVLNTSSLQDQYSTKTMNEIYQDERVLYLTQEGLKKYQVFYAQGKLYDMHHLPYQSRVPFNASAGNGDMIVMDSLGNLFIHPKVRGVMHHSSFFSAAPLSFAGICSVERGSINKLLTYSGHYAPSNKESENLNAMLSLNPLCQALYKKVQKNNRDYLVYDSGFCEKWQHYQGILCDLKGYDNRAQEYYRFRLIDVYQGALLKETQLRLPPGYRPQQISKEANGFAVLIEKQKQQTYQKKYKVLALDENGTFNQMFKIKGRRIVSIFGGAGESKSTAIVSNEEEGRLFTILDIRQGEAVKQFPIHGSGLLSVFEGQLIKENDFEDNQEEGGSITFYNSENGNLITKLPTIVFPHVCYVDGRAFYKEDETTFVGYNLKDQTIFMREKIGKDALKSFSTYSLTDNSWLLISKDKNKGITAYLLERNKLRERWSFHPKQSLFDLVSINFDERSKKLWGIHDDLNGHHIYKWDAISGELEFEDTLQLSRAAQIMAFHPNGTPIIQTHHY
ncbi:hypothetical protein [Candidatus Odyssella thessalonicensis]|uniref:hypothetical protein n=1 Tax=Candidatus Odyssella thessalonicensis TaxID=84647 RepID=UPI000225C11B|nr:hypothetical protein [Candidatus Odyssella thessalonicensis]